jgi:hypothetical protein
VAQLVEELHYKPAGHGVDSPSCHWYFALTEFFRFSYGTEVDLGNRNEHQEYFLGLKAASAEGWQTYHMHVRIVLKSENLKLDHSGLSGAVMGLLYLFNWISVTLD